MKYIQKSIFLAQIFFESSRFVFLFISHQLLVVLWGDIKAQSGKLTAEHKAIYPYLTVPKKCYMLTLN